jgi:hypothetical protein
LNLSIEQLLLYHHYIKKISKVEDLQKVFNTAENYNVPSSIKRLEFSDLVLQIPQKEYSTKKDTSLLLAYEDYIYNNHAIYSNNGIFYSDNVAIFSIHDLLSEMNLNSNSLTYLLRATYLIRHGWFIHEEIGTRFYIISPDTSEEYYIDSTNPNCTCTAYNCFHYALVKIYMKYRAKLGFIVIE